jgi:hypothetical protein
MNALKPRAPFKILIMSEISRFGREQIATAFALEQLMADPSSADTLVKLLS